MTITPEQIRNTAKSGQQMRAETLLEIADRLEATESPRGDMSELIKLPCCGYYDATAIKWNSFNGVVQCHNCGQVYSAITQQAEPFICVVMYAGHVMTNATFPTRQAADIYKAEMDSKYGEADLRVVVPLYTAPASGVREGMLRAAEICKNLAQLCDPSEKARGLKNAATVIEAEAITRAADQVNESRVCPNTLKLCACDKYAPCADQVSQQDAVSVPKQLKAFVKWARDMRSKHALSLIDAIAIDGVIDRITALLDSNKRTPYTNADNGSYGPEYQGQPPLPKGE